MSDEEQLTQSIPSLMNMRSDESYVTRELLSELIPLIKEADLAKFALRENMNSDGSSLIREDRDRYEDVVRSGEEAKRRLVSAALPLIKNIVGSEFKKRENRGSNVQYEDMLSEGMVGFLKGIRGYDPTVSSTSATNYIGQWVITEIRRGTEREDHSFSIPYETSERIKRIKAIRSRLRDQLDREPTDKEIVEAWDDRTWRGGKMLGPKASTKEELGFGQNKTKRNSITVKHVQEEREHASRTGAVISRDMIYSSDGSSDAAAVSERFQETSVTGDEAFSSVNEVDERAKSDALTALFYQFKEEAGVKDRQFDVIARRFGLEPYGDVSTLKQIAHDTGLSQNKVSSILSAFQKVMVTPNGAFHRIVSSLNEDELEALNLGWVSSSLGKYVGGVKVKTPNVLKTDDLS